MKLWKLLKDGAKNFKPRHGNFYDTVDAEGNKKPCGCAIGTMYLQFALLTGRKRDFKEEENLVHKKAYSAITEKLHSRSSRYKNEYSESILSSQRLGMTRGTLGGMVEYLFEKEGWSRERIAMWLKKKNI